VTPSTPEDAITAKAYVLFYRVRGTEGEAVRAYNAAHAARAEGKK
jgi:hypothetical protein